MDFALSETQEMLRQSAREFLSARDTLSMARGALRGGAPAPGLWREVSALGWAGLTVPEGYGGAGLGLLDLATLLEEWGAALGSGPLLESAVSAAVLMRHGSDAQRVERLPGLADGTAPIVPALHEERPCWDAGAVRAVAVRSGGSFVITGEKRFVPYGDMAGHFLVVGQDGRHQGGLLALLVPRSALPDSAITPMTVAGGEPVSVVRFDEIPVPVDSKLPGDGAAVLDLIMRLGAAGRAVQMAGTARAVVDGTVSYVSARKQFGRPVGSFQAVQHHLANMAAAHRAIRSLAYRAVWKLSEGEDGHLDLSRAKLTANESLPKMCWTAHQCHGAIGFTWEHNLHLFTRRALTWRTEYGDSVYHRRVIANAVIAANAG